MRLTAFLRESQVNLDLTAAEVLFVEHGDRFFSRSFVGHGYEHEATRATGFTIERDEYLYNLTSLSEVVADFLFRSTEWNAADKQFCRHVRVHGLESPRNNNESG